jgi:SAM-dependent methyltransferase
MPQDARSMLDVGSADGVRAARIARRRGLSRLVLSEPSTVMLQSCRLQGANEVWAVEAQHLPRTEDRFDVVTCLWNVLAQVPGHASRIDALRRMRRLLAPHGSLFLDVQNRYNVRWYGLGPTLGRALHDVVLPSEHNGDARTHWSAGGTLIPTDTHFFTPAEVLALVRAAGLRVKRRHFVDYGSGETRRFFFEGQIVCELEHAR